MPEQVFPRDFAEDGGPSRTSKYSLVQSRLGKQAPWEPQSPPTSVDLRVCCEADYSAAIKRLGQDQKAVIIQT